MHAPRPQQEWAGPRQTGRAIVVVKELAHHVDRIAGERGRVVGSFAEHLLDVAHRRPANQQLNVEPGRAVAVDGSHRLALRIAVVVRAVSSAVAQIDATHEGDVEVGTARVRRTTDF